MDPEKVTSKSFRTTDNHLAELMMYRKVYGHCISKMQECNKRGLNHCIYRPPKILFGEKYYNEITCLSFIIKKLRNVGFDVIFKKPDFLFITWIKDSTTAETTVDNAFLNNEDTKTEKLLKIDQKKTEIFPKLIKYNKN